MNAKAILSIGIAILGIFGVAALSIVFIGSLKPTVTAARDLPQMDISTMQVGDVAFIDYGSKRGVASRYMVFKKTDSKFYVFEFPLRDGVVMLPELSWDQAWLPCHDFGPVKQKLNSAVEIALRCRSNSETTWWHEENVWLPTGENMGRHTSTENLKEVPFSVKESTLIIGKQ